MYKIDCRRVSWMTPNHCDGFLRLPLTHRKKLMQLHSQTTSSCVLETSHSNNDQKQQHYNSCKAKPLKLDKCKIKQRFISCCYPNININTLIITNKPPTCSDITTGTFMHIFGGQYDVVRMHDTADIYI